MMNTAAASACGSDIVIPGNPVPLHPAPSLLLPIMNQLESTSFLTSEQLTISSANMEANVPALLAPASNTATVYTSGYGPDHDIFQFHPPSSHYLAAGNPYSYFPGRTFLPTLPDYHFPSLLDENMVSFGTAPHAQLGLNYGGYQRYYYPTRGEYAYGHHRPRCQVEPPRCQVEGCTADLSGAKRYHRRHRVCEDHAKAPVVITAGAIMPQRFCQQCSRFHEVDEFDDAKKSCRQRLADHNRRRRKPKLSSTYLKLKKRAYAVNSTTANAAGSSIKSMGTGDILGGATTEHVRSMGHGEVAREPVDPKGKEPMKQQARIPQRNLQQLGFPFLLPHGSDSCIPQNQFVPGGNTSNIAQLQEPCLAVHQHHHQRGNKLQLGQAVFDPDFDY